MVAILCACVRHLDRQPFEPKHLPDPHSDPQQENAMRNQRDKEARTKLYTQQKALKRAGNGSLGALDTLRNQQVAGSSPASSSKNWSKSTDFAQFLLFQVFVLHQDYFNPHRTRWISVRLCQLFQVKGLLTNTPKVPQKEGKHQRKDCVFSLVLLSLHRSIPAWWMQLSHPPRYSPRLKGHGCERMP